jgi:hypothetical protein
MHLIRVLSAVVALACAACDSSAPTAPTVALSNSLASISASSFGGTWVGTFTSSFVGPGTATVVLEGPRADGSFTGRWSVVFSDASQNREGSLTSSPPELRRAPGSQTFSISAALVPVRIDTCSGLPLAAFVPDYRFELALAGADRMAGESLFAECYQLLPGHLDLVRREM